MLGLGLGLSLGQQRGGGSAPAFDPATLSLSGYWEAPYTGSPWVGLTSAGTSLGKDLAEGTNPPTAVDGEADFDGTNDQLVGAAMSNFITDAAYSGWALVNVDAIATDSTPVPFDNDAIVSDSSSRWFVYLRSSGLVGLQHQQSTTADRIIVTTTFSTGAKKLVQWRYDGVNIQIRVNDGAWQSTAAASLLTDGMAGAFNVGRNYNAGRLLNGKMHALATSKVCLTDEQFDNVYSRYAALL